MLFVVSIENLKPRYHGLKHYAFLKVTLVIIFSKCDNEDEKIFKEKESVEILKLLGLIVNI